MTLHGLLAISIVYKLASTPFPRVRRGVQHVSSMRRRCEVCRLMISYIWSRCLHFWVTVRP